MNQILFFIFGVAVGGVAVWLATKKDTASFGGIRDGRNKSDNGNDGAGGGLIDRQKREKEANKNAILGLLETQGPLTNNQVEQMLGISDATVTRYFEELEREGRACQIGKTGPGVYYEKI